MRRLVIALLAVAGCDAQRVHAKGASDLRCPSAEVVVNDRGGGTYEVSGCGQTAVYVCGLSCEQQTHTEPTGAPIMPVIPAGNVKMKAVERDDVRFELPEWFSLDDDEAVHRDPNRHHAVRLTVADWDKDAPAWLDERHPGAKKWIESVAGREVHFATKLGSKLRLTVSVIAVPGKLYELACTNDDVALPRPDETCTAIVRSLRTRIAPKPMGTTI